MNNNNLFFLIILSIYFLCFNACTPVSKITYMNSINKEGWGISPIPPKHKIEIGDIVSFMLYMIQLVASAVQITRVAANLF